MKLLKILLLVLFIPLMTYGQDISKFIRKDYANQIIENIENSPYDIGAQKRACYLMFKYYDDWLKMRRTILRDEKETKWNKSINNNTPEHNTYLSKNINWVKAFHDYDNQLLALDAILKDKKEKVIKENKWLAEQKKKYATYELDYSKAPKINNINYRAYQMDVYVNNKFQKSDNISGILEFKDNIITTSATFGNDQLRYFHIKKWEKDITYLIEGPVPTYIATTKNAAGSDCDIIINYVINKNTLSKHKIITAITLQHMTTTLILYCEPTTEGIHDNDYVPLPDHYFMNRDYTDKEIIEFLSMFGDPTIMEALIMNDIMFGK